MSLNSKQKHLAGVIDARRRRVAALKLRGMTAREICKALEGDPERGGGFLNPETNQPWSLGTIGYDLKWLSTQWQADAKADIAAHKAAQLAELHELKRAAWAKQDLELVRKCLTDEAKLLGTQAPQQLEQSGEMTLRVVYGDDGPVDSTA